MVEEEPVEKEKPKPAPTPAPTPTHDDKQWDRNTVYVKGDQAIYNGELYTAKWWTKGDNPRKSGKWGVWEKVAVRKEVVKPAKKKSSKGSGGVCVDGELPGSWGAGGHTCKSAYMHCANCLHKAIHDNCCHCRTCKWGDYKY